MSTSILYDNYNGSYENYNILRVFLKLFYFNRMQEAVLFYWNISVKLV
jgi:hypothetical protein